MPVLRAQTARDCWTVAFGNAYTDEDRCLAAGYDNGDVKLFDLRTQTMRWETNVKNGVTGLDFDRNDIEMNKVGQLRQLGHIRQLRQPQYGRDNMR